MIQPRRICANPWNICTEWWVSTCAIALAELWLPFVALRAALSEHGRVRWTSFYLSVVSFIIPRHRVCLASQHCVAVEKTKKNTVRESEVEWEMKLCGWVINIALPPHDDDDRFRKKRMWMVKISRSEGYKGRKYYGSFRSQVHQKCHWNSI